MTRSLRPSACRHIDTRLGPMLAARSDAGLLGLWFVDQRHFPDTQGWPADSAETLFSRLARELDEYLTGQRQEFDLPLDLSFGTAFQQSVWHALLAIPYGQTTTYGALAARLGKPAAARAVGAATGRNPISIVVPCHRLFGADSAPTGYAGGIERKMALQRIETRANTS